MSKPSALDKLGRLERYDYSGMLELIESLPEQCERAVLQALKFELPDRLRARYDNILCSGMGGSAIGADFLKSILFGGSSIPVIVNRDYTLPDFVDKGTLVLVSSYSGNTEETLSAFSDAVARKADIIAITSGGELARRAVKRGVSVMRIPAGMPPRCAIGYSFYTLLILVSRLGLTKDRTAEIKGSIKALKALREGSIGPGVRLKDNIAKSIASGIYKKLPFIYGASGCAEAAATRWKGQLAENSKVLSSTGLFPEMNHNEIVGWRFTAGMVKNLAAIFLRDRSEHPKVSRRMDLTRKIIEKSGASVYEVSCEGYSLLSRMVCLSYIGDFVSYYLAALNGVDPTPVKDIEFLKKALQNI